MSNPTEYIGLRPYKAYSKPVTLRESLQEQYLPKLIKWLSQEGWNAALAARSTWQVVLLGFALMDWLQFKREHDDSDHELAEAVLHLLTQDMLPYLLNISIELNGKLEVVDSGMKKFDETICWDNHSYDTGLVLIFLIRLYRSFQLDIPLEIHNKKVRTEIPTLIRKGLKWIISNSSPHQNFPGLYDTTLSILAHLFGSAFIFTGDQVYFKEMRKALSKLKYYGKDGVAGSLAWQGQGPVLSQLSYLYRALNNTAYELQDISDLIQQGIQPAEAWLMANTFLTPDQVENLHGYIMAHIICEKSLPSAAHIDETIVLRLLHQYCSEVELFKNSVYHSLQFTTEFSAVVIALVSVEKQQSHASNWAFLDKSLMELYGEAIRRTITEQDHTLRVKLAETLHNNRLLHNHIRKRDNRILYYKLGAFVALSIFIAYLLWEVVYPRLPQQWRETEVIITIVITLLSAAATATVQIISNHREAAEKSLKNSLKQ